MRPDRDDTLGRAIRQTLREDGTGCPDAETLAAYADRAIGRADRRDVERHLSGCARCRNTLLFMTQAADAEKGTATFLQEAKKGGSPLFRWPWLAGAAAAGLAVVLWTATRPDQIGPPELDATQHVAEDAAREKRPVFAESPEAPAAPPPSDARVGAPPAPSAAAPRAKSESLDRLSDLASKRRSAAENEARDRRQAPAQTRRDEDRKADDRASQRVAEPGAKSAVAVERQRRLDESLAESVRSAPQAKPARPAPRLWRITPDGSVERSDDGGTTWTGEIGIDVRGVHALTAPSQNVCWIVGEAGLIVRYDGRVWTRAVAPADTTFVAVEAVDGRRATITTADGRRFTTTDGGVTWVQETRDAAFRAQKEDQWSVTFLRSRSQLALRG